MPLSEPTQTRNQSQEVEAQNVTDELFEELIGALDDVVLSADAAEADKRKELYAMAASVFA